MNTKPWNFLSLNRYPLHFLPVAMFVALLLGHSPAKAATTTLNTDAKPPMSFEQVPEAYRLGTNTLEAFCDRLDALIDAQEREGFWGHAVRTLLAYLPQSTTLKENKELYERVCEPVMGPR